MLASVAREERQRLRRQRLHPLLHKRRDQRQPGGAVHALALVEQPLVLGPNRPRLELLE